MCFPLKVCYTLDSVLYFGLDSVTPQIDTKNVHGIFSHYASPLPPPPYLSLRDKTIGKASTATITSGRKEDFYRG